MSKTILITGATDGIGLTTAKLLSKQGHTVLLHGRNVEKLEAAAAQIPNHGGTYVADLSSFSATERLAETIKANVGSLDVLVNNAGVFRVPQPKTAGHLDVRFVVNTLTPLQLTEALLPLLGTTGRVVNLSSAAQAPVDIGALEGQFFLDDMGAYAQSKLGIAIWTRELAREMPDGPVFIAVNPGSLLASKMVKDGFGVAGNDLSIGAKILSKTAIDPAFANASGKYFDNDAGAFANPQADALNSEKSAKVMSAIRRIITAQLEQGH